MSSHSWLPAGTFIRCHYDDYAFCHIHCRRKGGHGRDCPNQPWLEGTVLRGGWSTSLMHEGRQPPCQQAPGQRPHGSVKGGWRTGAEPGTP